MKADLAARRGERVCVMTIELYDSCFREIGHFTSDNGKRYIIINQSYWYDADKWTDKDAIEDFKKRRAIG